MLVPNIEAEIAELATRYGAPQRVVIEQERASFSPLNMDDRYGEVCMVVRRPNGKLITAIKTFYPPGAYRLLTGGVNHGEPIAAALLREVAEETGLDVLVRRFLAVIEYQVRGSWELGDGEQGITELASIPNSQLPAPNSHFATFAFLIDEVGGTLTVQDADERIGSFREIAVAELPVLATTLANAPDVIDPEIGGSWRDWGRFRAISHRVVYELIGD
jgi:NAD+ diphosphatase